MSQLQANSTGQVVSVLAAQVDLIESKELPMTRAKADVCRESGWSWMESFFTSQANKLELELQAMRVVIDRQLDAAAAR